MTKNYMKDGKWIDRPGKLTIYACKCGNKFVKTRRNQKQCIPCLASEKMAARV